MLLNEDNEPMPDMLSEQIGSLLKYRQCDSGILRQRLVDGLEECSVFDAVGMMRSGVRQPTPHTDLRPTTSIARPDPESGCQRLDRVRIQCDRPVSCFRGNSSDLSRRLELRPVLPRV